ncbi:ComF family protein [Enterococcus sp. LJL128]|uniref:ComF family protein n=1 Tax=Enterococcus sp. LJL51 TaxID=3416656 RepID=UPI003CF3A653
MNCLYCNQKIVKLLPIPELLLLRSIHANELCNECLSNFRLIEKGANCPGCCREQQETSHCDDCRLWQQKYPDYKFQHTALFHYNKEMKHWFEEYKFKGNYQLRFSFSKEISGYLKNKNDYLIVPIPLSEQRLKERRFNQVEGLLTGAGISYSPLLLRNNEERPQAQKNREERLAGQQPFCINAENKQQFKKRSVILVDDIYTTGRTLFFAAELFLEYPVEKIETFSLAR